MKTPLFLLVVLPVTGLIWLLTEWLIKQRLQKGWLPLAAAYPLIGPVAGLQITLAWVSVGGSELVGDKNLVRAGATVAGLSLRLPLLAWLHPPLRIPWAACGPFRAKNDSC